MNQFTATVKTIDHVKNLHLVSFELGNQTIKMLSLELNRILEPESTIQLRVKSTNIALAKNFTGAISYANQLQAKVISVNNGILLSSIGVTVEGFRLESLVTLESSLEMNLCVGDEVTVLIKGSEVFVCG
jgi:molybdopterin-binding protein